MPVHHFLVTFTVPQELRWLLRARKRDGYGIIFDAGAQAIKTLGSVTKSLKGCQLGFFGVLHTWGRDPMVYHPHVHFVIPGGGVDAEQNVWKSTPENFLFHHRTACRIYKAKIKAKLAELGLLDQVDTNVWKNTWTVDIQAVGNGQAVLKYLAPYVYRVAISDKRIEACDESGVTYRYTPSQSGKSFQSKRSKTRQVDGVSFVNGFLQHVLPRGFQKVRYYGWMSANSRWSFEEVRWLVYLSLGWRFLLGQINKPASTPKLTCGQCGGGLRLLTLSDHHGRVVYRRPSVCRLTAWPITATGRGPPRGNAGRPFKEPADA